MTHFIFYMLSGSSAELECLRYMKMVKAHTKMPICEKITREIGPLGFGCTYLMYWIRNLTILNVA